MVHGAGAEARIEVFGAQRLEIFDDPRPQVEDVVPEEDGQKDGRCGRYHLVKEVLFSITVTLTPSSCASTAALRPIGPAPTTVIWQERQVRMNFLTGDVTYFLCLDIGILVSLVLTYLEKISKIIRFDQIVSDDL